MCLIDLTGLKTYLLSRTDPEDAGGQATQKIMGAFRLPH